MNKLAAFIIIMVIFGAINSFVGASAVELSTNLINDRIAQIDKLSGF